MGVTKRTVLDGVFVFADEERHRFTAKQSWELRSRPLQRQCTGLREGASGRDWKSNPQLEHPLCFLSDQRQWFSQVKTNFSYQRTRFAPKLAL
ncbi:hypothetical protein CK203_077298 [Vitis vinifera]|uniref:Uncharacterized protein n=1 Tax=Vitis vinifera TaxID=29760 RepID=A0A438EX10_VITVI|nr:hypothetical protein CK203_077298 [Vitis vinifera]